MSTPSNTSSATYDPAPWDHMQEYSTHFLWVPTRKLLVCRIDKVASSLLSDVLCSLNKQHASREYPARAMVDGIYDFEEECDHTTAIAAGFEHRDILGEDSEWTRAVWFRDPLERFLSAYLSKCAGGHEKDGPAACEATFGSRTPSFEAVAATASYHRFTVPSGRRGDAWRPQSEFCSGTLLDGGAATYGDHTYVLGRRDGMARQLGALMKAVGYEDPEDEPTFRYHFVEDVSSTRPLGEYAFTEGRLGGSLGHAREHAAWVTGEGWELPWYWFEREVRSGHQARDGGGRTPVTHAADMEQLLKWYNTPDITRDALMYVARDYLAIGIEVPAWAVVSAGLEFVLSLGLTAAPTPLPPPPVPPPPRTPPPFSHPPSTPPATPPPPHPPPPPSPPAPPPCTSTRGGGGNSASHLALVEQAHIQWCHALTTRPPLEAACLASISQPQPQFGELGFACKIVDGICLMDAAGPSWDCSPPPPSPPPSPSPSPPRLWPPPPSPSPPPSPPRLWPPPPPPPCPPPRPRAASPPVATMTAPGIDGAALADTSSRIEAMSPSNAAVSPVASAFAPAWMSTVAAVLLFGCLGCCLAVVCHAARASRCGRQRRGLRLMTSAEDDDERVELSTDERRGQRRSGKRSRGTRLREGPDEEEEEGAARGDEDGAHQSVRMAVENSAERPVWEED